MHFDKVLCQNAERFGTHQLILGMGKQHNAAIIPKNRLMLTGGHPLYQITMNTVTFCKGLPGLRQFLFCLRYIPSPRYPYSFNIQAARGTNLGNQLKQYSFYIFDLHYPISPSSFCACFNTPALSTMP